MSGLAPKLKKLVKRHAVAGRPLFSHLGAYANNMRVTHVDNIARKTGLSQRDVRAVFSDLAELSVGRLIPGRHGHRTRFEWSKPLTAIARLANGDSTEELESVAADDDSWLEEAEPSDEAEEDTPAITECYRVPLTRRGAFAQLDLPIDLTKDDVKQIKQFLDWFQVREA